MDKNIDEVEFTIFDTETTGLEPESGDKIVEIAGIRFIGEKRIAVFQELVNPRRMISEAAFAVNKITQEMLRDAPGIETVLPKFLDFIQGSCLCSYNAGFDLEFLNSELKSIGKTLTYNNAVVDILKMARRILPRLERYALWFVADKLGVKAAQKHRALSDVELTLEVFHKLKAILQDKGIMDFQNFLGLFGLNSAFLEDINNQKLAKIQQALDLRVSLKIKYLSSSSATVSEREVIPKEIKQEKNRHYLVGYCCLRKEERTFRVDGILHLEIV
ncbi:MAG: exonuclease domain-containing protein [Candidatus Omnitrophica bacterium]|nr:exonuclease domain-containing protein [Candidatus Omnitrophota bacterium]MDD5592536.1 exonuclease domain-containing protein [Candidatus Omnitrophota bacterium]